VAIKELPFHKCACLTYCYGMVEIIEYNVGETSNGIMFIPRHLLSYLEKGK